MAAAKGKEGRVIPKVKSKDECDEVYERLMATKFDDESDEE